MRISKRPTSCRRNHASARHRAWANISSNKICHASYTHEEASIHPARDPMYMCLTIHPRTSREIINDYPRPTPHRQCPYPPTANSICPTNIARNNAAKSIREAHRRIASQAIIASKVYIQYRTISTQQRYADSATCPRVRARPHARAPRIK